MGYKGGSMNNNLTPFEVKKTLKDGLIYLLIALPFMLLVATLLTIINAAYWLTMLATVVVGGFEVLLCVIIHGKIKEKRKENREKDTKFDPFRD